MGRSRSFIFAASLLLAAGGLAASLGGGANAQQAARPLYKDASQPIARRVEDLLSRMTLEEKVAQMVTVWEHKDRIQHPAGDFSPAAASQAYPTGLGHVARDAISFPQAIGLASTWDPALSERIFIVASREMRARGAFMALAPVVDVARDPRWGRIEETYGEDPYLVSEMSLAAIRGFQGTTLPLGPQRVFVTLKHMTGHGQPENGTNVGPAEISERTLRENFFPPFERAVRSLPIRSVMASYNEIDGVPSPANRWLLHDVLRGEWRYQGAVVSDYFAIC